MLNHKRPFPVFVLAALALSLSASSAGQSPQRGVKVVPAANAEERVALVIGNAKYAEAPLTNPVNDARAMAKALRDCGFHVFDHQNLTREQMLRAIDEFRQQLKPGTVALFYFAGHGMQVKGENYLIPVDAQINREIEVKARGVELQGVLEEMSEAQPRINLVILDACRNNPFARSFRSGANGLGTVNAPSGTLIAYATAPNSTASDGAAGNGLYTQELLAAIRTPGLIAEQVFKRVRQQVEAKSNGAQTPWENSSLKGDFYFVPDNGAPVITQQVEPATHAPATATPPVARDAGRWEVMADRAINVSSTEAWTDTRIQIKPGQDVRLKVDSPEINLGALGKVGPGGVSKTDERKPARDCATGAVIARLGQELFCIDHGRSFSAAIAGSLFIGLNETNVKDNQGAFIVKVFVQEFRH